MGERIRSSRTMKARSDMAAMATNQRIHAAENQSASWPLSSTTWIAVKAMVMNPKPM